MYKWVPWHPLVQMPMLAEDSVLCLAVCNNPTISFWNIFTSNQEMGFPKFRPKDLPIATTSFRRHSSIIVQVYRTSIPNNKPQLGIVYGIGHSVYNNSQTVMSMAPVITGYFYGVIHSINGLWWVRSSLISMAITEPPLFSLVGPSSRGGGEKINLPTCGTQGIPCEKTWVYWQLFLSFHDGCWTILNIPEELYWKDKSAEMTGMLKKKSNSIS